MYNVIVVLFVEYIMYASGLCRVLLEETISTEKSQKDFQGLNILNYLFRKTNKTVFTEIVFCGLCKPVYTLISGHKY